MDGLSPTSIVGAPYNSLQIGTVVSFAITYFFATVFLAFRYVQTITITKKLELDLGKSAGGVEKWVLDEFECQMLTKWCFTLSSHPHYRIRASAVLLCDTG